MIKTFLFPPNVQDSGEKLGRENHRGWPGHTAPGKVFLRIVMKKECLCLNHNDYDDDDKVMKLMKLMIMMMMTMMMMMMVMMMMMKLMMMITS